MADTPCLFPYRMHSEFGGCHETWLEEPDKKKDCRKDAHEGHPDIAENLDACMWPGCLAKMPVSHQPNVKECDYGKHDKTKHRGKVH